MTPESVHEESRATRAIHMLYGRPHNGPDTSERPDSAAAAAAAMRTTYQEGEHSL
jgi:hypothetical protein